MNYKSFSYRFATANNITKLIVIQAALFLAVRIVSWILRTSPMLLAKWFVLPTDLGALLYQPWSLFTYSFLHLDFWHILWNMLYLYWFGQYVRNLFTPKRFLTIYLLGGICGGLFYLSAYNLFPVLQGTSANLLGASAAVYALLVFIATYAPNTAVRLIFFTVRLWHIALFLVLRDLVAITESVNAGGLIAHIGGALFGYVYAMQLKKGNDLGIGFENLMDRIVSFFSSKKKYFRAVHKNTNSKSYVVPKRSDQRKIDEILDKIGKSGYDSLTQEEKDILFRAGKN